MRQESIRTRKDRTKPILNLRLNDHQIAFGASPGVGQAIQIRIVDYSHCPFMAHLNKAALKKVGKLIRENKTLNGEIAGRMANSLGEAYSIMSFWKDIGGFRPDEEREDD